MMLTAQSSLFQELVIESSQNLREVKKEKTDCFLGTDNPRHKRVIQALLSNPRTREAVDRIAGASNGPELMAELRRRGLDAPCQKVPALDRDGLPTKVGIYSFTADDRKKIELWKRLR